MSALCIWEGHNARYASQHYQHINDAERAVRNQVSQDAVNDNVLCMRLSPQEWTTECEGLLVR